MPRKPIPRPRIHTWAKHYACLCFEGGCWAVGWSLTFSRGRWEKSTVEVEEPRPARIRSRVLLVHRAMTSRIEAIASGHSSSDGGSPIYADGNCEMLILVALQSRQQNITLKIMNRVLHRFSKLAGCTESRCSRPNEYGRGRSLHT